jgi:hypothetical protein
MPVDGKIILKIQIYTAQQEDAILRLRFVLKYGIPLPHNKKILRCKTETITLHEKELKLASGET